MDTNINIYLSLFSCPEYFIFSYKIFYDQKYVQTWDYSRQHVDLIIQTWLYQMAE